VRVRLSHVEIDGESGRGAITVHGHRHEFKLYHDVWGRLAEVLDERRLAALLRTLDDDLGRYEDVVSVVGEVAEHVFRGRIRTRISVGYTIVHTIEAEGLRGSVETIFDHNLHIFAERYGGPRRVEYEAGIRLENGVSGGEEDAMRLLDLFFDELAGILGVPEVGGLKKARYTSVELYENRRRFRGV
jgi:predicted DNA-binding ribbon-helix-helix protein